VPGAYDIELDGIGYVLVPGTYQRMQEPLAEGRLDRVRIVDFYGGSGRALQQERDRFWVSVGAVPALDSQGVSAGPKRQDLSLTVSPAFDPTKRTWAFATSTGVWVVNGANIYQLSTGGGLFAGLQHRRSLAAVAVDAIMFGQYLYVAFGSAATVGRLDTVAGSYVIDAFSGVRATRLGVNEGNVVLVEATAGSERTVRQVSGAASSVTLDYPVLRLFEYDGSLWALTNGSLWRLGKESNGAVSATLEAQLPLSAYGDDGVWVVAHLDGLYLWRSGRVMRARKRDGVWVLEPAGPAGQASYGACVVGVWLICEVRNQWSGASELWGYDGRGWWQIEDGAGAGPWQWPVSIAGAAGDAEVLAGRASAANAVSVWQVVSKPGMPGLRASWSLTTSLLDAGERDRPKLWRGLGCELAWPDERATSGTVYVQLEYSADGGKTWAQAGSEFAFDPALYGRRGSMSVELSPPVKERYLQVRVSMRNISSWCPVLVGVWAEYELVQVGASRKKWRFAVQCRDGQVLRNGAVHTLSAWEQARELWEALASEAAVTFKDIDYDVTGVVERVRVVGVRETLSKGERRDGYGAREVEVTLVEV